MEAHEEQMMQEKKRERVEMEMQQRLPLVTHLVYDKFFF